MKPLNGRSFARRPVSTGSHGTGGETKGRLIDLKPPHEAWRDLLAEATAQEHFENRNCLKPMEALPRDVEHQPATLLTSCLALRRAFHGDLHERGPSTEEG